MMFGWWFLVVFIVNGFWDDDPHIFQRLLSNTLIRSVWLGHVGALISKAVTDTVGCTFFILLSIA